MVISKFLAPDVVPMREAAIPAYDPLQSLRKMGSLPFRRTSVAYASYLINKTPEEIYTLYQKAHEFVSIVGVELRACSTKLT
jgi:hypothetical protein